MNYLLRKLSLFKQKLQLIKRDQKTVKNSEQNCLTCVGVGPGDPSLLTLAAVKAIENATLVAYPISSPGEESMAAKIASHWLSKRKKKLPLLFPMVSDESLRKESWKSAAKNLVEAVDRGENVAFLSQGDISLFSTSCYLLLELQANYPHCPLKLVPGINSFSAAAAAGKWPLALQNDQLLIAPAPENSLILRSLINEAFSNRRVLVLLKLGKRWKWIRPLLEEMNLLEISLFAQKVGFPEEMLLSAKQVPSIEKPYFSLLIIRQCWPDVIPSKS